MNLIVGIVFGIALIAFLFYSAVAIKHAARFRYLGPRTVYLTLFYVSASAVLLLLAIGTYILLLAN